MERDRQMETGARQTYTRKVNSNTGFVFSPDLFAPSFPRSQLLDVCQAAQLVKSHRHGISETLRDVMKKQRSSEKKKEKNRSADCLLASRLCLHCATAFYDSLCECAPSVHVRVWVRVFFLADEVTMRDRDAGRACHCQSPFWLLFCFLPEEEKVLHGNQQPPGVMWCHGLSVCFACVH